MKHSYVDLDIYIQQRQANGYPVKLELRTQYDRDHNGMLSVELPDTWVSSSLPDNDGKRLLDWFCANDAMREKWIAVQSRFPRRRVRLHIDADELHALPWELLLEIQGDELIHMVASAATPFLRHFKGGLPRERPLPRPPLRILVAIANPSNLSDKGLAPIDAETEWDSLQAITDRCVSWIGPAPGTFRGTCGCGYAREDHNERGQVVLHCVLPTPG